MPASDSKLTRYSDFDMSVVNFAIATANDLGAIVALLADDPLGKQREQYELPLPQVYTDAFTAITKDPNNELIVGRHKQQVIALLQLTYIPSLTHKGSWRAQIEGVRVIQSHRDKGVGKALLHWSIERAVSRGCRLIQLTTDKSRPRALEFYQGLGFVDSHKGLKLVLKSN